MTGAPIRPGHVVRRLRRDERGVSAVELGLLLFPMSVLLLGGLDLGYQAYVKAVLDGTVQKAGRDSSIVEGTATTDIDAKVSTEIKKVAGKATIKFSRKNYSNFTGVKQPEPWQEKTPLNGVYDKATECFTDKNGNGAWDADLGKDGLGGADDVVYYKVDITYPRIVPIVNFIGGSNDISVSSMTILRNQPYAAQDYREDKTICP